MADASTPPTGEPTPDPTPDPTPKTFTQDDLNRIVQERVAKERSRFGDYDALKEKAGKFDALEEASKTETQKLIDRVAELERAGSEAERRAQEATLRGAVVAAAAGKLKDVDMVHRIIDMSQVTFDDDGQPTNLDELVAKLVADRPHLAVDPAGQVPGTGAPRPVEQGPRGTDAVARDQLKSMRPEDIVKALDEGRLDGLLGTKR